MFVSMRRLSRLGLQKGESDVTPRDFSHARHRTFDASFQKDC